MKLCTAVQEGCGYKDTLSARRYFAPLAKYFTVCITYQPPLVSNACYEVMPFSLTHLLAIVGVAVSWPLCGRLGDSLVRWGVLEGCVGSC